MIWFCSFESVGLPLVKSYPSGAFPVFSGVCVTGSLVLCVFFVDRCLSFCTFLLAIVLSALLRYTDTDYPLVSSNSPYALTNSDLLTSGNPTLSNEQNQIIFKQVFEYIKRSERLLFV
jgi:hypothetical protein